MNRKTCFQIKKEMFTPNPYSIIHNDVFNVTALKYESGVEGLEISNGLCSMVILPYMGHQIWSLKFHNKSFNQQSIFDYPLSTTKFGDNYGAFLIHCGLTNINGPDEGENYPLHGELPFAVYKDNFVALGEDDKGSYLEVGGLFEYRNSQDYHYEYNPRLKMYANSTVLHMDSTIRNKRHDPLNYLFMCHMNWLGFDKSQLLGTVVKDFNHIKVQDVNDPTNIREQRLYDFVKLVNNDLSILDKVDFDNQFYTPELCVDMKYTGDKNNWGHALQILPDGDSCYVGFNTTNLPYGLRWYCKSFDENGLGLCLPTTGTHHSSKYQYKNGHYNTIPAKSEDIIQFKFGYLDKTDTDEMKTNIHKIMEGEH